MMEKYIIYARVATQDQLDKNDLQNQVEALRPLVKNQKGKSVDTHKIIGNGESFLKGLIERLCSGEKIALICMDLDRLTRDKSLLSSLLILVTVGKLKIITPKFTISKQSLKNTLFMVKMNKKIGLER